MHAQITRDNAFFENARQAKVHKSNDQFLKSLDEEIALHKRGLASEKRMLADAKRFLEFSEAVELRQILRQK